MDDQSVVLRGRAMQGDAQAFIELCGPYSTMIYRHCLSMLRNPADAEDAAQETLLRAYRSMPRFAGRSGVATWLYRIAHNTCLDVLKRPASKRQGPSLEALQEEGFPLPDEGSSPEEKYIQASQNSQLQSAIKNLPEDQQLLLSLRYGEGMDYQQLSRATGLREGTVKSKLNRAKNRLKIFMQKDAP